MNDDGPRLRFRPYGAATVVVLALAAATAFYKLGAHSLWFDEITGARVAELDTVGEVIAAWDMDSHPPATALAEHWSRGYFGLAEWALRLPAALASVAAVGVIVAFGAALGDVRVGLLAGALAALSPVYVVFAQDARPYALAMLFTAAASVCFLYASRGRRLYIWFPLYAASVALAFYTHYFTVLVIGVHVGLAAAGWFPRFRPRAFGSAWWYLLFCGLFVAALGAAVAFNWNTFAKALYDRDRFPGGEMTLWPSLIWGAFATGGWNRATANVLFLVATAAGGLAAWRRFGAFAGAAVFGLAVIPLLLPVFIVRFTTQFWHPRFSYFGFPGGVVAAAFGFVAIARGLAPEVGRRLGVTALAAAFAAGALKAAVDDRLALKVYYGGEHQDFRAAVALANRNRDWHTKIMVYPYRNWDSYEFYTRTQGGPAAEGRPRFGVYEAFEKERRIFFVSTDAELDDELLAKYPLTVQFRLARVDVLFYDRSYRSPADVFRRLPVDFAGLDPALRDDALARTAVRWKRESLAVEYGEAAVAAVGEENTDIFYLADAYLARGDTARARRLLTEYVRRRPEEHWPFTRLADVYLKRGDRNTAIACFRRAAWLEPGHRAWQNRLRELMNGRKFWRVALGYSDPRWL